MSQVGDRAGDSFASPTTQRDRIEAVCGQERLALVEVVEELDVSGGTPLDERGGLRGALEAVEDGRAEVIVAAYFDRLFRSVDVQREVVQRVEAAGGRVRTLDVGDVTDKTAGQWLSGTLMGAFAEYQRRSIAERSAEAQAKAVERGVVPWPNIPPGYTRQTDGTLAPNADAGAVREAFELRADGATWNDVRARLAGRGIKRSYHGVGAMLRSRVYLGEIHFGALVNTAAHEAIVDAAVWDRAQRAKPLPGRRAKSERLLARLGILRCGTCDARMVVGTAHNGSYWLYRCPPNGNCPRRVTISATLVEDIVVGRVREALADVEGRASVERNAREAEAALERADADLAAAIRAFAGLEGEQAAVERLGELRQARDECRERVHRLGGERGALAITAAGDWDRLSIDARRALVRLTVARARVAPGRGAGRVTVELVGEEPAGF